MKRQHAVCSLENNDELNKRFDKRFTDTITRSGLKDKFEDLDKFLLSIYNALNETFRRMEEEAYAWLNGYLCDDKDCWCHCAIFMGFAAQFGKIVESFFKKFTNTRMHGKHVLGVDGERIFHDLYKFSPIASSTFEMDLFTIDDYGENYERINEKYKKVIQLISNIYAFSVYIDNKAKQIAADGEKSKQCLIDFLTPFREERSKSFNGNFRIYPDEIENAKSKFSTKIVEEIDTLNLSELSKKYYHEVDSLHGVSFAILMWVRILRQQGMTDVEYEEVFKHIEDPYVRASSQ